MTGSSTGGAKPPEPPAVRRIATEADARDLAKLLLTPGRSRPVVVVTIAGGQQEPFGDPERIKESVGDLADVILMPTSDISWAFSKEMPPQTQVYGGAGRVYPVDERWMSQPSFSRLRFAYSAADGSRLTDQLIDDTFAAALAAGLLAPRARPGLAVRTGQVAGVYGSRAIVTFPDRTMASVWEELTLPGVPLERLLAVGQEVTGVYDPDTRRLDLRASVQYADPQAARAAIAGAYELGDVVLADVADVADDTVRLRLLPELVIDVDRRSVTSNPNDVLRDLFTVTEIVACRLASLDPLRLRLDDIDDEDEPRAAPNLLPGGPPWLRPPEPQPTRAATAGVLGGAAGGGPIGEPSGAAPGVPAATAVADAAVAGRVRLPGPAHTPSPLDLARRAKGAVRPPADDGSPALSPGPLTRQPHAAQPPLTTTGAPHVALDLQQRLMYATNERDAERATRLGLSAELADLREQAARLEADLAFANGEISRLQTRYRTALLARQRAEARLKGARADLARPDGPAAADAADFADPEEQFRHEIYLEWARRIPAAEKPGKPLATYRLLDGFLDSVAVLEGVSRAKIVSVVVEILTGQAHQLAGRDLHRLRTGPSGGAPYVTRADGAICYRVALQRESAAARRLHYWHTRDGEYELSRVALHDDFRP